MAKYLISQQLFDICALCMVILFKEIEVPYQLSKTDFAGVVLEHFDRRILEKGCF